jgi:hypothetical protein
MPTTLTPGTQLFARHSEVRLIVVTGATGVLTIDGEELVTSPPGGGAAPRAADGPQVLLGKRYHDPVSGLEVLCTHAGAGVLAFDARPVEFKTAKALPSSD